MAKRKTFIGFWMTKTDARKSARRLKKLGMTGIVTKKGHLTKNDKRVVWKQYID